MQGPEGVAHAELPPFVGGRHFPDAYISLDDKRKLPGPCIDRVVIPRPGTAQFGRVLAVGMHLRKNSFERLARLGAVPPNIRSLAETLGGTTLNPSPAHAVGSGEKARHCCSSPDLRVTTGFILFRRANVVGVNSCAPTTASASFNV